MARVTVTKTCKLFINGAFPRSESGRTLPLRDAEDRPIAVVAHASRKDLRDAVEAASAAQPGWAGMTAYNRGQVLYRVAEMMEGRSGELAEAIRLVEGGSAARARREVAATIDRVVSFAGWTDKIAAVLGNQNAVAGPFYTFTVPEAIGVVAVIAPEAPSLLGAMSLAMPVLAAGNTAVLLTSDRNPLPAVSLMEILATSDVPAGVVNLLTGRREELLAHVASHREIGAISGALERPIDIRTLELGAAENLKRVRVALAKDCDWDEERWTSPWSIEPFVDFKTIWHPSAC